MTSNRPCEACRNRKRQRKHCEVCHRTGYQPCDVLRDSWAIPGVAFLVCGGPSLKTLDLSKLQQPGIVSLGVNNAAAHAHCTAFTFSDPQYKFFGGLFLDPKVICLVPTPKLGKRPRMKAPDEPDGFTFLDIAVNDCPNTWGYGRKTLLDIETFLETDYAHWGWGGKQGTDRSFSALNTMFLGLRLVHYLGARVIYLLGVDFNKEPGQWYAWDQEKGAGGGWNKSIELLHRLRPTFDQAGVSIRNCNPNSRLRCFPFVHFHDALEHARGAVPEVFDLSGWYNKQPVREAKKRMKLPGYQHRKLETLVAPDPLQ